LKAHGASYLGILVVLLAASGASCPTLHPPFGQPVPVVFPRPPTLQEVIAAVNANSVPIQQLQTDSALLSVEGAPSLRASVALQPPRNFRLRAQFIGMGEVLDLGSNEQLFWALIDAPQLATGVPRAVYYARHDQYRSSAARNLLPIQPSWLIEAFGVVQLDPAAAYEGPYTRGPGQLEIRTRIATPEGDVTKVIVLHDRAAWIMEQHWYDAQGQLIASVLNSNHKLQPAYNVTLPHRIAVRLPPPNRSFQIAIESYAVNQLYSDPGQLWTMPSFEGYPLVDLAAPLPPPYAPPDGPAGPSGPMQMPAAAYPQTGYRPVYRGYSPRR
jgi:hypothetical protein